MNTQVISYRNTFGIGYCQHGNPWSLYMDYGKDTRGCGPRGRAQLTGGRLVQETSALEGGGLTNWEGGIKEGELFTSPFYEG